MGNIFSFFYEKKKYHEYDEELLKPLNEVSIDSSYALNVDIEKINNKIDILEKTTQSSLINISKDIKFVLAEINQLKINNNNLDQDFYTHNDNESVYLDTNN